MQRTSNLNLGLLGVMNSSAATQPSQLPPTKREISCPRMAESSEQRAQRILDSLLREKSVIDLLPPTSCYVMHRLKVINRAIELLSPSKTDSVCNSTELDELLAALSLS